MSKNLKQHIKLLKQEYNQLRCMQLNGDKLKRDDVMNYYEHLIFCKQLLQQEKFKKYSEVLNKRLTNFNR
jgi:hypothetical protein